jgi:hypothetical protein
MDLDKIDCTISLNELNRVIDAVGMFYGGGGLYIKLKRMRQEHITNQANRNPEITPEPMEAPETEADVDNNDEDGGGDDRIFPLSL